MYACSRRHEPYIMPVMRYPQRAHGSDCENRMPDRCGFPMPQRLWLDVILCGVGALLGCCHAAPS